MRAEDTLKSFIYFRHVISNILSYSLVVFVAIPVQQGFQIETTILLRVVVVI